MGRNCLCLTLLWLFLLVSGSLQVNTSKISLNSSCDPRDDQCGSLAICELHSKLCQCNFGNVPLDEINCQPFHCTKEGDCVQKYGKHSICTLQNVCACDFDSGWSVDLDTLKSCSPGFHILLNHTCNGTDGICGRNAFCGLENANGDDKTCRCLLGYSPDLKGEINCNWFVCKSDSDCVQMDAHAQCSPVAGSTLCTCNYMDGYKLNDSTQKCVPRNKFLGQSCSTKSEQLTCGSFAFCDDENSVANTTKNDAVCKCQFGYIPRANKMDCDLLKCQHDSQCQELDSNSECASSICFCKFPYTLNRNRNICVRSFAFANFVSPVFIIFVICFTFFFN